MAKRGVPSWSSCGDTLWRPALATDRRGVVRYLKIRERWAVSRRFGGMRIRAEPLGSDAFVFGGLSIEETAEVMNISESTVKRDWILAKTWIFRALSGESAT